VRVTVQRIEKTKPQAIEAMRFARKVGLVWDGTNALPVVKWLTTPTYEKRPTGWIASCEVEVE
jgi:hypothetical protein